MNYLKLPLDYALKIYLWLELDFMFKTYLKFDLDFISKFQLLFELRNELKFNRKFKLIVDLKFILTKSIKDICISFRIAFLVSFSIHLYNHRRFYQGKQLFSAKYFSGVELSVAFSRSPIHYSNVPSRLTTFGFWM